jgi:UrcA family protein
MFSRITTPKTLLASALLAGVSAGAAPSASAEQSMHTFQVVFAYNSADAPQKIYAELRDTAHKACHAQKFSGLHWVRAMNTCKAQVVEAALGAMGRSDIAMLHTKSA